LDIIIGLLQKQHNPAKYRIVEPTNQPNQKLLSRPLSTQ